MIGRMSGNPVDEENLVRRIQASGRALVLALTGGGSRVIAELLTVPGASRFVLEALVPYSEPALARFLGGHPDHFCSSATARAMAMAAYLRAVGDAPGRADLLGVAAGPFSISTQHVQLFAGVESAGVPTAVGVLVHREPLERGPDGPFRVDRATLPRDDLRLVRCPAKLKHLRHRTRARRRTARGEVGGRQAVDIASGPNGVRRGRRTGRATDDGGEI